MTAVFISEIKLPETDDFSRKFNHVSDLFARCRDQSLSEDERNDALSAYIDAKTCLEMGY